MSTNPPSPAAKRIARELHRNYEALAPLFGYATRAATAVDWDDENFPKENKALMEATAQALLDAGVIAEGPVLS